MSNQIHKSAIRTVASFQTVDGLKFHTAAEAQEHTRNFLIDSIISAAVKTDPQYARLDADLLRKFCRSFGRHLGEVTTEPFHPIPAERTVGLSPLMAAPYGGGAVTNTTRPGEAPRHGEPAKTSFGKHPLDSTTELGRRVDDKYAAAGKVVSTDTDGLTDEEIQAVLEEAFQRPTVEDGSARKAV